MNDTDKKKILEFCGWRQGNYWDTKLDWFDPDGKSRGALPEITCDWLFTYFVPAWNKQEDQSTIWSILFTDLPDFKKCCIEDEEDVDTEGEGITEAEAFAEAALKLIEAK